MNESVKKPGQVSEQMNELADTLDQVEEAVALLGCDLEEVVRKDDRTTAAGEHAELDELVPLAHTILMLWRQAQGILFALKNIDDRLEL